ncbi:MAG: hypothetical protein KA122_13010, partial [Verrucomicrobia bacterium]|nr:hypothetical protein [Verrucomicrobiota bacterium]HNW08884.1 hypothetical protein [Verrucomicrobiota bacterium]HOH41395.1 hypothetical protein [Verrucomicrobiota bacterium]HPI66430.1 hypothetical protein [Verrucomicrobiota bacterium]HPV94174.1 hypothetical protein [Verrucomicrobiota bacterium]
PEITRVKFKVALGRICRGENSLVSNNWTVLRRVVSCGVWHYSGSEHGLLSKTSGDFCRRKNASLRLGGFWLSRHLPDEPPGQFPTILAVSGALGGVKGYCLSV